MTPLDYISLAGAGMTHLRLYSNDIFPTPFYLDPPPPTP